MTAKGRIITVDGSWPNVVYWRFAHGAPNLQSWSSSACSRLASEAAIPPAYVTGRLASLLFFDQCVTLRVPQSVPSVIRLFVGWTVHEQKTFLQLR